MGHHLDNSQYWKDMVLEYAARKGGLCVCVWSVRVFTLKSEQECFKEYIFHFYN